MYGHLQKEGFFFFHVPRNIRKLLKYWITGFEHPFYLFTLLSCKNFSCSFLKTGILFVMLMTLSAEQMNGVKLPLTSPAAVLYQRRFITLWLYLWCFYWVGSCNGEPVLWNISSSASFYNVVIKNRCPLHFPNTIHYKICK